jgi:hypothetical protein
MWRWNAAGDAVAVAAASGVQGGGFGGVNPPEIPKFYKVEPDCKLSGNCLVFLFKHSNNFKNC